MHKLKAAIAGILTLLATATAFGQGGIGNFPMTVPAQTVVGRLGITPGPTQAIPITQLAAAFGATQSVTVNARCDGATDDTAAINADLAKGGWWTLPPNKTCAVTQLNITVSGTRLSGSGFNTSILKGTTAGVPTINVSASLSNVYLNDFQVTKSVTATNGGTGIKMNGDCQYCAIESVFVQKHYVGISLLSTGVGYIKNVLSQYNVTDGVALSNSAVSGTVQWDLDDVFSAQNGARGFLVVSGVAGPTAIALGSWHNVRTFANTGGGIFLACSVSIPCNGFRLSKGFLGEDGSHEIFLDTYGGLHTINSTYLELAGTRTTGPTLATAASHTGDGIRITANNTDVSIGTSYITGNWDSGINTSATVSTNVSGFRISLHSLYGIISANCALLNVSGTNFVSNTTNNIQCTTNGGSQLVSSSTPSTLNIGFPIAGVTGMGTGVGTWLATPSGANLAAALTSALPISKGGTGATTGAVVTVKKQIFTASGTWTPSAGMIYAMLECPGSGGGGGAAVGGVGASMGGGGGGAGSPSRRLVTAAQVGASQTVTIGAAGVGGAAGSNNGTAGGDVSVGTLCIGKGGAGGLFGSVGQFGAGGAGGVAGTGDIAGTGATGQNGTYANVAGFVAFGANGGSTQFGGGGLGAIPALASAVAGSAASVYGAGGGGAISNNVASNAAGGNGSLGVVFITEFNTQ